MQWYKAIVVLYVKVGKHNNFYWYIVSYNCVYWFKEIFENFFGEIIIEEQLWIQRELVNELKVTVSYIGADLIDSRHHDDEMNYTTHGLKKDYDWRNFQHKVV